MNSILLLIRKLQSCHCEIPHGKARERAGGINEQLDKIVADHQAEEAASRQIPHEDLPADRAELGSVRHVAAGQVQESAGADKGTPVAEGADAKAPDIARPSRPWRQSSSPSQMEPDSQGCEPPPVTATTESTGRPLALSDWRDHVIFSAMAGPGQRTVHSVEEDAQLSLERGCPEIGA